MKSKKKVRKQCDKMNVIASKIIEPQLTTWLCRSAVKAEERYGYFECRHSHFVTYQVFFCEVKRE